MLHPLLLKSVPVQDRHQLPRQPGVYYAMRGKEILYIGETKNLRSRWCGKGKKEHEQLKRLLAIRDARLHYQVMPAYRRKHEEALAIRHWKPRWNKRREKPVWWITLFDNTCVVTCALILVLVLLQSRQCKQDVACLVNPARGLVERVFDVNRIQL